MFCTSNCNTQLTDAQYNLCCDSENYGNFIRVTKENANTAYLVCPLVPPDWCTSSSGDFSGWGPDLE